MNPNAPFSFFDNAAQATANVASTGSAAGIGAASAIAGAASTAQFVARSRVEVFAALTVLIVAFSQIKSVVSSVFRGAAGLVRNAAAGIVREMIAGVRVAALGGVMALIAGVKLAFAGAAAAVRGVIGVLSSGVKLAITTGERVLSLGIKSALVVRDTGVLLASVVANGIGAIKDGISKIVNVGVSIVQRVVSNAISVSRTIVSGLQTTLSAVQSAAQFGLRNALILPRLIFSAIVDAIKSLAGSIAGALRSAISQFLQAFVARFTLVIVRSIVSLVSSIGSVFSSAVGTISGFIYRLVTSILPSLATNISGFLYRLVSSILPSLITNLSSIISGVLSALITSLGVAAIAVVGVIGNFAVAVTSKIFSFVGQSIGVIGRLVTTTANFIAPYISSFFGVIRNVIGNVATALQSAFAVLATWAKTAFSWVSGLVSRGASFLGGVAGSVGSGIVSAITAIGPSLLRFGGTLLQFVPAASILGAFTLAVSGAARSALDYARNVRQLSALTGFSTGASAVLTNRLGAQGVGPGALQSLFGSQSPFALSLKTRAFGLPDVTSPGFASAAASRFQSFNSGGPISQIMGRAIFKNLGMDGTEWTQLLTSSPRTIRQNADYSSRINSNLGLSPSALSAYAEQVPSMLTRIGAALQSFVLKLAGEALPAVEEALSFGARLIGDNAAAIGAGIKTFVQVITGPVWDTFVSSGKILVQMASSAFKGFVAWANWGVANIEATLQAAGQYIGATLTGWAQSFGAWSSTQITAFTGFLSGLGQSLGTWIADTGAFIGQALVNFGQFLYSSWSNQNSTLRTVATSIATTLDTLANGIVEFGGQLAKAGAVLGNILAFNPIGQLIALLLHTSFTPQNPQTAYTNATAGVGKSNIAGLVNRFFAGPILPTAGGAIANAGTNLIANSATFGANLTQALGGIASNFNSSATSGANAITGLLNGAGGFFSAPQGQQNILGRVGKNLADNAAPFVSFLNTLDDGLDTVSSAISRAANGAQSDRRQNELAESIRSLKDALDRNTRATLDNVRVGGRLDLRELSQIVRDEYARDTAAALRRAP